MANGNGWNDTMEGGIETSRLADFFALTNFTRDVQFASGFSLYLELNKELGWMRSGYGSDFDLGG